MHPLSPPVFSHFLHGLSLTRFRNFSQFQREAAPLTLITGANGRGKTTLLEAIYFAFTGKSFRESRGERLIARGATAAFGELSVKYQGQERMVRFELGGGGNRFSVDGVAIPKLSDFYGRFPVIYGGWESRQLFYLGPDIRRAFMDGEASKGEPALLPSLIRYKKICRAKGELLRQGRVDPGYLEILNREQAHHGAIITRGRVEFLRQLEAKTKVLLPDQEIRITYSATDGVLTENDFFELLKKNQQREIARKHPLFGPHRHDFEIFWEDKSVIRFGSTGQKKLCALLLLSAIARWLQERRGAPPIWLLDDLAADLDQSALRRLAGWLDPNSQLFVTLLPHQWTGFLAELPFYPGDRITWDVGEAP